MSLLRRLRKAAGYYKWFYLQGGRKRFAYAHEAKRLQDQSARHLDRLTPIKLAGESDVEVHVLCGVNQAVMAIWGLWSFSHFTGGQFATFVHSDGSLTPADVKRFQKFFPNIHNVDPGTFDGEFRQQIGDEFAFVRRFRDGHMFGHKLIDPHLSRRAKVILLLDTDIIFFSKPDEVLERCEQAKAGRQVTSGLDARCAYVADPEAISQKLGVRVAEKLNAGLVIMPKFDRTDFELIERSLHGFEAEWVKSYFAEQTLYAIFAGEHGWHPLSDRYPVGRGSPDSVAIHYASGLRHRFFTEGVPRLLAIAKENKHPATKSGAALAHAVDDATTEAMPA
jgi:hypothetical protein